MKILIDILGAEWYNLTIKEKENFEMGKLDSVKKRGNKTYHSFWGKRIKIKDYAVYWWALLLFPFALLDKKIRDAVYRRRVWSSNKADKILEKVLKRALHWDEEDKLYYLYLRDFGCYVIESNAGIYKSWAKKFTGQLKQYLINEYELKGYEKTAERDYDWWYITFKEKSGS